MTIKNHQMYTNNHSAKKMKQKSQRKRLWEKWKQMIGYRGVTIKKANEVFVGTTKTREKVYDFIAVNMKKVLIIVNFWNAYYGGQKCL